MDESRIENEIVEELKYGKGNQKTELENAGLEKEVRNLNATKNFEKKLGKLRRETFFETKGNQIYYKTETVNNYLKGMTTSNKRIKEHLINDRKTIVTAVQIALYKAGYLPVGLIDGRRGPITRGAVDKFQRGNGLGGQKNPGYLNVNTLNKLIEVTSKKEEEKKKPKKIIKKVPVKRSGEAPTQKQEASSKRPETQKKPKISKRPKVPQIKAPAISQIEAPKDNTNVTSRTFYESAKEKRDLNKTLTIIENGDLTPKERMRKNINKLRKKGNSIWKEMTSNVGTFREWHNGDYKFEFYDKTGNLPSNINILGENYKYTVDGDNLNGLGFESYYGGHSLRIGEYTDGFLNFGTVYSYDGLRETGSFNINGDLIEGVRIETDGSLHIIENYIETDNKNLLSL